MKAPTLPGLLHLQAPIKCLTYSANAPVDTSTALGVVSGAGHVIELADGTHHCAGFFCCIACPAAAISVRIDHESSSCRSMSLSSMSYLSAPMPSSAAGSPALLSGDPPRLLAKVRRTVLGCPFRINPWKRSTLSTVFVAVTRGMTDQLVKAAGQANFWPT